MSLAIKQLSQWNLAATPINYAIVYAFIDNQNAPLSADIKKQIKSGKSLDNFYIEEIYKNYILGQSKFRHEIVSDISDVLNNIKKNCQQSTSIAQVFISQLDENISSIQIDESNKHALSKLRKASTDFKSKQEILVEQLQKSQQQTDHLRIELQEVKKEIYHDPVTGLYNRKAMTKHVDQWIKDDPDKTIALVVININHFPEFIKHFGSLLSDVILSKIADKVSSYVDISGLPVRSSGDEFLILLPDVEADIATEIAKKIRQGVDKLRFVSVKTGVRLPKVSISLAVNKIQTSESLTSCITRTRKELDIAKESN